MTTREEYQARRKAWVEALRSGEYEQGSGGLRDEDTYGFCALGIACDVSGLGAWDGLEYSGAGRTENLMPVNVTAYFGLTHKGQDWISQDNDAGASLVEIADTIERETADLFIPEAL